MRTVIVVGAVVVLGMLGSVPASAQTMDTQRFVPQRPAPPRPAPTTGHRPLQFHATGFAGLSPSPALRGTAGVAFGAGLSHSGFELEYASTAARLEDAAPKLQTFTVNGFVNLPVRFGKAQLYAIGGYGIWNEAYGEGRGAGYLGSNFGAGLKITLNRAVKVRMDYRAFFLDGSPDGSPQYPHPQRLYAGICVGC